MRRRLLLLALPGLLALPTGMASTGTTTTCYGGGTDSAVIWVDPPALAGQDVARTYISLRDGSVWQEGNDRPGLQRTSRVCYEQTFSADGVLLSSRAFIEFERDVILGP